MDAHRGSKLKESWLRFKSFSMRKKTKKAEELKEQQEEEERRRRKEEEAKERQRKRREYEDARPDLDPEDMKLVQMSWDIVQEDLAALGHGAFDSLFMSHPEIKDAFGPFRELTKDDIHFDKEIRLHGVRVLRTVETVLDSRYDSVRLVRLLHNLGRKHVTYRANSDYFEIVGRQFMLVIASVVGEKWTPEVDEAWSRLFTFVAYCMREAMFLASLDSECQTVD